MSATYRNQKSSTTQSDWGGASMTVGPQAFRSSIVTPYVVSVFGVRRRAFEVALGSVIPICRAVVSPAVRRPLRNATREAPGTALRNTSMPRMRSSAS